MQILNVDFMLGIWAAISIGALVWLLWRTRTLGGLSETVPDIPFGGSYTKNSDSDNWLPDMSDDQWAATPRSSIASAEKKPRTRRVKKVVKKTVKKVVKKTVKKAAKTLRPIRYITL